MGNISDPDIKLSRNNMEGAKIAKSCLNVNEKQSRNSKLKGNFYQEQNQTCHTSYFTPE